MTPSVMRSSKISFIIAWKVAGEFVSPKYITSGSKRPRFVQNAAVRARPCEVVKVSTEPSKMCKVFEGLFKILRVSSRGNPKLIYKQNEVKIQRWT